MKGSRAKSTDSASHLFNSGIDAKLIPFRPLQQVVCYKFQ